jgi:hypothetical protein
MQRNEATGCEDEGNPNHHLWNNHGTWFVHYTRYPTPFTKERVRRSLQTKSLVEAREKRDAILRATSEARRVQNIGEESALSA